MYVALLKGRLKQSGRKKNDTLKGVKIYEKAYLKDYNSGNMAY